MNHSPSCLLRCHVTSEQSSPLNHPRGAYMGFISSGHFWKKSKQKQSSISPQGNLFHVDGMSFFFRWNWIESNNLSVFWRVWKPRIPSLWGEALEEILDQGHANGTQGWSGIHTSLSQKSLSYSSSEGSHCKYNLSLFCWWKCRRISFCRKARLHRDKLAILQKEDALHAATPD